MEHTHKKIGKITFGVFSPKMIKKMSTAQNIEYGIVCMLIFQIAFFIIIMVKISEHDGKLKKIKKRLPKRKR